MGDEIFPDEVMEIRVQMTKRYREPLGFKADSLLRGSSREIEPKEVRLQTYIII